VNDKDIDEALKRAAQSPYEIEPALLERVASTARASLRAVRPLPPTWILSGGLVLIVASIALAGAARAGFYGIEEMGLVQRALIFSTLTMLAWVTATKFVHEMIPGSRRWLSPRVLLGVISAALLGVFALLFRDYQTYHFLSAGIVCLLTGFLFAIPAGLLSWLVLRRGFAVSPVSAGLAAGTLAGLAGVAMLELHCENFQAAHVLVWHTAVVPLSAVAGALLARSLSFWADSVSRRRGGSQ
jgi:Negative regulator of sigma F